MLSAVKDIRDLGEERWNSFVAGHSLGSVYHHSAWHRVIERTYGYRTIYAVILEGTRIKAALPACRVKNVFSGARFITYPFSDYCDPLTNDTEELQELLDKLKNIDGQKKTWPVELRLYGFKGLSAAVDNSYLNYVIDLDSDTDRLFRKFHKACVQRAVKKAGKRGIEVIEADSLEQVKAFYGLHVLTRKKLGAPVQPFSFFKNIWELLPKELLSIKLAKRGNRFVSGVLMLKFKDRAYYKFGASLPDEMSTGANQLVMWDAIRSAAMEGHRYFDLGRTYIGNVGLMEYKSRWGAVPHSLAYFCLPSSFNRKKNEGSAAYCFFSTVLKKMPAFSNRILGSLLYKYLA